MRRRRGGFSLLEVMIALTVLAFGLLAMGMMQIRALREGAKGQQHSTALALARSQWEQIQRMPFSSPDLTVNGTWSNPSWINNAGYQPGEIPITVTDGSGGVHVEKVYRVWYRITADGGGNPDLRNVELEVRWTREGEGSASLPTISGLPTVNFSGVIVDNDR